MSENKQRCLYIDGQAVPVTEQVYRAYWHYTRKEEYFSRDLKTERFKADQQAQTATFTPSREDSYDRLLEQDKQFACESKPVEDAAVASVWMEELLALLTDEERQIIEGLFIQQLTERELGMVLGISQNTIHYWKEKTLRKLRKIMEENF